jgi:hypothetical protein
MSEFPTSRPVGNREWYEAWNLVRRLDAARQGVSDQAAGDEVVETSDRVPPAPTVNLAAARSQAKDAAIDPDELARAIADIEQASAALRQAEPTLGTWPDRPAPMIQPLSPRSAWMLIGTVWISTVLVMGSVIFAIASFVG